jgi:hypothetical protein
MVARSPFCLSAFSRAGVWVVDGPSSKVRATYPVHAVARAGAASAVAVTVPAAAVAATASPTATERGAMRFRFTRVTRFTRSP